VIVRSDFRPAWWLPGPHLQTIYPSLFRKRRYPVLQRQRIELTDGDFVDIDWAAGGTNTIVLVLHGLEGSLDSHYTGGLLCTLQQQGYRAGLMYFRGCSGELNRLPRSYHSGDTGDLAYIIETIRRSHAKSDIVVIGYSLGGNVLLKYLGESGNTANISRAIAISVPLDLEMAATRLKQGLSRIYQQHLLIRLRSSVTAKAVHHPGVFTLDRLHEMDSFHKFDNEITAPLHGFRDVADYYAQSSSKQYLREIRTPTLLIQAQDDPFLPPTALPSAQELGPSVTLELSASGGHVGFVAGNNPFKPRYWLEQRIIRYLQAP